MDGFSLPHHPYHYGWASQWTNQSSIWPHWSVTRAALISTKLMTMPLDPLVNTCHIPIITANPPLHPAKIIPVMCTTRTTSQIKVRAWLAFILVVASSHLLSWGSHLFIFYWHLFCTLCFHNSVWSCIHWPIARQILLVLLPTALLPRLASLFAKSISSLHTTESIWSGILALLRERSSLSIFTLWRLCSHHHSHSRGVGRHWFWKRTAQPMETSAQGEISVT